MNDELLELELRLLVLRYGKETVVETLAHLGTHDLKDLTRQLAFLEERQERKVKKRQKSKVSTGDILEAAVRARPDLADELRSIGTRFQNRTFLPNLRDVRHFLERFSSVKTVLKSREAALPAVLQSVANLSAEELSHLLVGEGQDESDYSLLSGAIMGTRTKKPPQT